MTGGEGTSIMILTGNRRPGKWRRQSSDTHESSKPNNDRVVSHQDFPEPLHPGYGALPDHIGHDFGPVHPETGEVVEYLDRVLACMRKEIADLPNGDRVDLIVVSDHGMASTSPDIQSLQANMFTGNRCACRCLSGCAAYGLAPKAYRFRDNPERIWRKTE